MDERPQPDFTLDEIAKEIAQVGLERYDELHLKEMEEMEPPAPSDPGLTRRELGELWGLCEASTKRRVTKLCKEGVYVKGRRYVKEQTKAGYWRWRTVPVYRLKKDEEKGGEPE